MRFLVFVACLVAVAALLSGTQVASSPPPGELEQLRLELEQLHLELEADRMLLAPNFHLEDSYLIEGTVLEIGQDWLKLDQHLDSPPQPIDPRVTVSPHSLVQFRKVDSGYQLLAVEHYTWQTAVDRITPGTDIVMVYLPHTKTAKSIAVYTEK